MSRRGARRIVAVESLAAWACHHAVRLLGRHQLAPFPHGVLASRPVPLVAPLLEVGFGPGRQEPEPRGFKASLRLIECCADAAAARARICARVEADVPSPLIGVHRNASTARNRADVDVTEIDVLAVLAFGIAAASEIGHGTITNGHTNPRRRQVGPSCRSGRW
jgi:hypothetical protein